jgi:hypothetical protein
VKINFFRQNRSIAIYLHYGFLKNSQNRQHETINKYCKILFTERISKNLVNIFCEIAKIDKKVMLTNFFNINPDNFIENEAETQLADIIKNPKQNLIKKHNSSDKLNTPEKIPFHQKYSYNSLSPTKLNNNKRKERSADSSPDLDNNSFTKQHNLSKKSNSDNNQKMTANSTKTSTIDPKTNNKEEKKILPILVLNVNSDFFNNAEKNVAAPIRKNNVKFNYSIDKVKKSMSFLALDKQDYSFLLNNLKQIFPDHQIIDKNDPKNGAYQPQINIRDFTIQEFHTNKNELNKLGITSAVQNNNIQNGAKRYNQFLRVTCDSEATKLKLLMNNFSIKNRTYYVDLPVKLIQTCKKCHSLEHKESDCQIPKKLCSKCLHTEHEDECNDFKLTVTCGTCKGNHFTYSKNCKLLQNHKNQNIRSEWINLFKKVRAEKKDNNSKLSEREESFFDSKIGKIDENQILESRWSSASSITSVSSGITSNQCCTEEKLVKLISDLKEATTNFTASEIDKAITISVQKSAQVSAKLINQNNNTIIKEMENFKEEIIQFVAKSHTMYLDDTYRDQMYNKKKSEIDGVFNRFKNYKFNIDNILVSFGNNKPDDQTGSIEMSDDLTNNTSSSRLKEVEKPSAANNRYNNV